MLKEPIFVASDVVPILYNNGGYIKYVGEGAGGFYKFFKKICSQGDHRFKYCIAQ